MTALVLGAGAGGGFPQWNCNCPVCALAWAGDPRVVPRGQAGIAVSADGENWLLCNASPDLRSQILATKALHPKSGSRHSPIKAVLLTGAEIDQTAGLLTLRERQDVAVYGTPATLAALADNPMFGALHPDSVRRRALSVGETVSALPGLSMEIFTVPGKMPLYLEGENPEIGESAVNVGVELTARDARLLYIPGAAGVTDAMRERMRGADVILFDGTLFTDDEMIALRVGEKTGMRMGHMPIDGPDGSLAALSDLTARRIFIHINNTNPVLIAGSSARQRVEKAGFEIAHDGMEIVL
ncbi:pyrroloquinoline quinone biosynthesis protein PqqB [Pseudorhodoplanes sp.]|uniref:pyrroloquinoline quinone biosynthesis protein PqqB n=1 Tax=Pseudorhodoplanes sp. TaxID=1934341 RepID=UPI002C841320|nr:pyrroloquinoline quinone biosynthesis protein PqqB [Pseudorhodoplanes sp.]HWV54795.1 pyrroloquinoline quinone biosynthesis protein PqqB [Pseudorhodoplanes sp.]